MTNWEGPDAPSFLPHCLTIHAEGAAPDRWMVILHGIYGRGSNWRAFARGLATRRPDWGFLLVDLRMHGQSLDAPAPHSLKACAEDVQALIDDKRREGHKVEAVLGHSFGGKVALEMLRANSALGEVWIVDSSPGPRPEAMQDPDNTVVSVLRMLQTLPEFFADRAAFVAEVMGHGLARPLADWLAMNLARAGEQFRWGLELASIEELLRDYFRADLWHVLETSSRPLRFVIATNSSAISAEEERRLGDLQDRGRVVATRVQGSHWLHVEAFSALLELVLSGLP